MQPAAKMQSPEPRRPGWNRCTALHAAHRARRGPTNGNAALHCCSWPGLRYLRRRVRVTHPSTVPGSFVEMEVWIPGTVRLQSPDGEYTVRIALLCAVPRCDGPCVHV